MLKRVLAWILLAGFLFLLLNIAIFHYYIQASIFVYLIIAVWFIFTNKPLPSRKKKSKQTEDEFAQESSEDYAKATENLLEEENQENIEENIEDNIEDTKEDTIK